MTKIKLNGLEIESDSNGAATQLLVQGLTLIVRKLGEAADVQSLLPPPEPAAFIPTVIAQPAPTPVATLVAAPSTPEREAEEPAAEEATVESPQAETPPQLEELQELFQGRRRGRRKPAEPATTRGRRSGKAQRLVIGTTMDGKDSRPMTPRDAAELAGSRQSTIKQACAPSMRGRSCGGYTWRWADGGGPIERREPRTARSRQPRAAEPAVPRPAAADRRLRKGAWLVVWDKKPTKPLSMKEAADLAQVTPSAVALAVKQSRPVKGFVFTKHDPSSPQQTQLRVGSADPGGGRKARNGARAGIVDENPGVTRRQEDDHRPAIATKPVHVPETYEQERAGRPRLSTDDSGKALPLNPNRTGATERPPMPESIAQKYSRRDAAMQDAAADLMEDDE